MKLVARVLLIFVLFNTYIGVMEFVKQALVDGHIMGCHERNLKSYAQGRINILELGREDKWCDDRAYNLKTYSERIW